MRAISRGLSRFCYNHPNLGIPDLIKYIALGNVFVYIADMLTNGWVSMFIRFYPELILQGQVWRPGRAAERCSRHRHLSADAHNFQPERLLF